MSKIRTSNRLFVVLGLLSVCLLQGASAQKDKIVWSSEEKPLAEQIHGLRSLSDDVRAETTKNLAIKIRQLPANENKTRLAVWLASLSTEGDFGHATLQEVTTTLAETLRERPLPWPKPDIKANSAGQGARTTPAEPANEYVELASLVRYEHVDASLDNDQYRAAWRGWRLMTASVSTQSSHSRT